MLESPFDATLQEDLEYVANANIPWEKFENHSVLVTGATGLIGSQIVKALLCRNRLKKSNIKVIAGIRNKAKAESIFKDIVNRNDFEFATVDATQKISIQKPVDYIVHTASVTASKEFVTRPVEVIETTLTGTRNVLELAKEKCAKGIVYLSSMEAFGVIPPSEKKSAENDLGFIQLNSPRSCYPESKRMAECLCAAYASEYGVPVKIARLSQTFGAGIHYSENRVFAQFAKSAIENKDIILHTTGNSWGNYCYTRDVVVAILILLVKGVNGEAYTVANEDSNIRIKDMAKLVAEKIAHSKIKLIYEIPESNLTFGYAPDTELHLSSAKMRNLGWKPSVGLEESYRRLIMSMLRTKE